jgi:hypothetical protein
VPLEKHRDLDDLGAAVGIPLHKKAEASSIIPTALNVRPAIAPMRPPVATPPTRPVLTPETFGAILDVIDKSGRQFELTTQTFQQLTEEGLRDVMLGNLNGVFAAGATGESFRGDGKVEIHLQIAQGGEGVAAIAATRSGPVPSLGKLTIELHLFAAAAPLRHSGREARRQQGPVPRRSPSSRSLHSRERNANRITANPQPKTYLQSAMPVDELPAPDCSRFRIASCSGSPTTHEAARSESAMDSRSYGSIVHAFD